MLTFWPLFPGHQPWWFSSLSAATWAPTGVKARNSPPTSSATSSPTGRSSGSRRQRRARRRRSSIKSWRCFFYFLIETQKSCERKPPQTSTSCSAPRRSWVRLTDSDDFDRMRPPTPSKLAGAVCTRCNSMPWQARSHRGHSGATPTILFAPQNFVLPR